MGSTKQSRPKARLPRGFRDLAAAEVLARRAMLDVIRGVYESYGFDPLETPAFEYADALGKFLPDADRPMGGVSPSTAIQVSLKSYGHCAMIFTNTDDAMGLLRRRIIVISLFCWLPLVILFAWQGELLGSGIAVPFLMDIGSHVRFLVVVPVLIGAELVVHRRTRFLVAQFFERK